MSPFDQRGQQVQSQYNAERDMNFGAVQTPEDLVSVLERLNEEFKKAEDAGVLPEETATDAQYQVTKAVQQAKKADPDKKAIVKHLMSAKTLIEGIAATSDIVTCLLTTIDFVHKLFP